MRAWRALAVAAVLVASVDAKLSHQEARRELGLRGRFTDRELTKAYRQRSLETHPDKGGSTAAFLRVAEAYEVLSGGSTGGHAGGPAGGRRQFKEKTAKPTEEELMRHAEAMLDEVLDRFVDGLEGNIDGMIDHLIGGGPNPGFVMGAVAGAFKWGAKMITASALDAMAESDDVEIDVGGKKMTGRDAAEAWREWRESRRKRRERRKGPEADQNQEL